jgi:alpha-beta hydrolase superfamily lysophospholipase
MALDMRAHGRSGGERIGLAFEEHQDAADALDWIAKQEELEDVLVALFGISMGGATAIRTAAQREDVDAVISVSAFASIDRMMGHGMRLMGAPGWMARVYAPFMRFGLLTAYGVWPGAASPLHDIPSIAPRPILITHGTADQQIPLQHAELLMDAAGAGAELWIVEDARHGVYTNEGPIPDDARYQQRIVSFLDEALGSAE